MTPSWYDILDVDPAATGDEVRTAWRHAIEGLEPTDRRFAVRNQAAAVLLDPTKRAAYDAQLADEAAAVDDVGPEPEPTPVETAPLRTSAPAAVEKARPSTSTKPASVTAAVPSRPIPGWLLVGLALVTAVVAIAAGYLYATSEATTDVSDAATAAEATAEKAIVPVTSYDYRQLAADKATAESFMTDKFRDDSFDPFFTSVVEANAKTVKPVATTTFVSAAVTNAQSDRVDVLVFFNVTSTNAARPDAVTQNNYATLRMKLVDGDWLIDDLVTKPVSG